MRSRVARPLTPRERAVLTRLLAVDFPAADRFRVQATTLRGYRDCSCGCPSISFVRPETSSGLTSLVEAVVHDSGDWIFLYAVGDVLGGIELVPVAGPVPTEFPDPSEFDILEPVDEG